MLHFINLSSDTFFLGCLFIVFLAFAMYFGKGRVISILVAYFPAVYFYKNFPFIEKLSVLQGPQLSVLNQIGILLLFLIPLSLILNKFIFSETFYSGTGNMFQNIGYAFCLLVLVMLCSYSVINLDVFHNFAPQIDKFFASSSLIFYWSLAPFVILAFL